MKNKSQQRNPSSPALSPKRQWNTIKLLSLVVSCMLFLALEWSFSCVCAQNSDDKGFLDRFTYQEETVDRGDGFFDYRPPDWNEIKCDEENALDQCEGYNYKWSEGINWTITSNFCKWCPDDGNQQCGRHHQSPINLLREFGLVVGTHPNAAECVGTFAVVAFVSVVILRDTKSNGVLYENNVVLYRPLPHLCNDVSPDLHWMKYEDSFCSLEELIESDAFSIERHGLRIQQPIIVYDDYADDLDGIVDGVRLDCRIPGNGSRFGRIDFSKGYSDWYVRFEI
jgi:hypothetical protein